MEINNSPRKNPPVKTTELPENSKLNPAALRDIPAYAVINRATGKHESRYSEEALKILAFEMAEQGKGGGIVDLLLPKTALEATRLKKIRSGHIVAEVTARQSHHKQKREALSDEVWNDLLGLYEEMGGQVGDRFVAAHFADWLIQERLKKSPKFNAILQKQGVYEHLMDTWFDKNGNEKLRGSKQWWQRLIAAKRNELKALLQAMYS